MIATGLAEKAFIGREFTEADQFRHDEDCRRAT
jgi:hypothetical protein